MYKSSTLRRFVHFVQVVLLTSSLHSVVTGESCTDPVITPSAYTTSDAVISSESVFIVELSLACANGAQVTYDPQHFKRVIHLMSLSDWLTGDNWCPLQSVTLYADVNGRQFPVTRGQDVGKYQVWFIWLMKAFALTVVFMVITTLHKIKYLKKTQWEL